MSKQGKDGISWTDETWGPIRGCSKVSTGCKHCFAESMAARFCGEGLPYHGLIRDGHWSGDVRFVADKLDVPLRWKRPRRIFVNSMSDLFHESLTNEQIAAVFGVMAACPQHVFQTLTKRPHRMLEFLTQPESRSWIAKARDAAIVNHEHDPVERWATVPRFPGYEASTHGRVRSERAEVLATCINPRTGRESVTIWNNGDPDTVNVHQLVAWAHLPCPFDGYEVCHRNGNKLDNRLANLRWGTRSENQREKVTHGSRGGPQKLTLEQVEEIKTARVRGETQQSIANRYGISRSLVSMIESGLVWAPPKDLPWPIPNVHLGVSCENQAAANERIPPLLQCPAAVRWVSAEPLLGTIDFTDITHDGLGRNALLVDDATFGRHERHLDWVVCGGESGPHARPMHPDWARSIRDQCRAAGVPFHFKQHGEWVVASEANGIIGSTMPPTGERYTWLGFDGKTQNPSHKGLLDPVYAMARVGKKRAGHLLDGQEYRMYPGDTWK